MQNFTISLAVLAGIATLSVSALAKDNPSILKNTSFTGATYKTSTLPKPDAELCSKACNGDKQCKAWTYRARGARMTGYKPQCYLKNKVPAKVTRSGYTSGIKNIAMGMTIKNTQILSRPMIAMPPANKKKQNSTKVPVKKMSDSLRATPRIIIGQSGDTQRQSPQSPQPSTRTPRLPSGSINATSDAAFMKLKNLRSKALKDKLISAEARAAIKADIISRHGNDPYGYQYSHELVGLRTKFDCDDNDSSIHPNQNEVCNYKDDNCNGQIDEGVTITVYRDADGDGFGDPAQKIEACSSGGGLLGMSLNPNDCDDSSARLNPAAGTCE